MTGAVELIQAYIDAGLAVLPLHSMRSGQCTCRKPGCHSPAKHPLTRNGKDDATLDRGTVAEWLARWPGCNWGVRPPEGVVIVDIDPRNGGHLTFAEWITKHGPLPKTLTAITGSNGYHLWFSYSGRARGKLGTGIDCKTHTGYVVAPPSLHASGRRYEWTRQVPAAYPPKWLIDLLNPPVRRYNGKRSGRIDPLAKFVLASGEGERNSRLHWAACRAAENGLDPTPLADAAASIGLTGPEITATIRSAASAAPRKAA